MLAVHVHREVGSYMYIHVLMYRRYMQYMYIFKKVNNAKIAHLNTCQSSARNPHKLLESFELIDF